MAGGAGRGRRVGVRRVQRRLRLGRLSAGRRRYERRQQRRAGGVRRRQLGLRDADLQGRAPPHERPARSPRRSRARARLHAADPQRRHHGRRHRAPRVQGRRGAHRSGGRRKVRHPRRRGRLHDGHGLLELPRRDRGDGALRDGLPRVRRHDARQPRVRLHVARVRRIVSEVRLARQAPADRGDEHDRPSRDPVQAARRHGPHPVEEDRDAVERSQGRLHRHHGQERRRRRAAGRSRHVRAARDGRRRRARHPDDRRRSPQRRQGRRRDRALPLGHRREGTRRRQRARAEVPRHRHHRERSHARRARDAHGGAERRRWDHLRRPDGRVRHEARKDGLHVQARLGRHGRRVRAPGRSTTASRAMRRCRRASTGT